jgi:hypothetical protein
VTPVPDTVTIVAPVRLVPVRVTGTVVLPVAGRGADAGEMEVSVGPVTVNAFVRVLVTPLLAVPTVTLLGPTPAVTATEQFAVTVVAVGVPVTAQVTPVAETVTALAPVRRVPERVTGTVDPRAPEVGEIVVSVGANTVNVGVFAPTVVVPIGVVTLTCLVVAGAVVVMAQFAVTVVTVGVPVIVQETPAVEAPMVTTVAPVRPLPVRVTGTVEPRIPEVGEIEANVGPWTANVSGLVPPAGVFGVKTVTVLAVVVAVVVITKFAVI